MRTSRNLMALEPGSLMHRMFRDFDRVFTRRGGEPFLRPAVDLGEFPWAPDVEMAERDHHLTIKVDLPGLKKDEVSLELAGGYLLVSGSRTREAADEKIEWMRSERSYGAFSRMIPVPDGLRAEDVTATFTDGVLEIVMPMPAAREAGDGTITIGEGRASRSEEHTSELQSH